MSNEKIRKIIGLLFQSRDIAVESANIGKTPEQQLSNSDADWIKVAMSLPRLYAVVEAAEIALAAKLAPDLLTAFEKVAEASDPAINEIANRCARLAWQSQQPLLGYERILRPIMGCTSGNLPEGELEKDAVRMQATAAFVLTKLS